MGIRIHKSLGFGFTAAQDEYSDVVRKQPASFSSLKVDSYLDFLEEKYKDADKESTEFQLSDLVKTPRSSVKNLTAYNIMSFSEELPNEHHALVITPLMTLNEWKRWDDSIDYVEHPNMEDEVKLLEYAPFPYEGGWMHRDTGEPITRLFRDIYNIAKAMAARGEYLDPHKEEEVLTKAGFASWTDAEAKMVPQVPQEVKDLAEWMGVFNKIEDWKLLRPMLLTYWS